MDRNEPLYLELGDIGIELLELEARAAKLYARRLELWNEAVARPDPPTQRELGEISHTSEGAVTQALRKQRLQSA